MPCPVLYWVCLALPSLYLFWYKGRPFLFSLVLICSRLICPVLCSAHYLVPPPLPAPDPAGEAVKVLGKHLGGCTWIIRQAACTVCTCSMDCMLLVQTDILPWCLGRHMVLWLQSCHCGVQSVTSHRAVINQSPVSKQLVTCHLSPPAFWVGAANTCSLWLHFLCFPKHNVVPRVHSTAWHVQNTDNASCTCNQCDNRWLSG